MNLTEKVAFTGYQKFIIAILAILQFTIILDFMVLSPLGPILFEKLHLQPSQFGWVVSGYAFSAFASGVLTAGFADKYDRKKLLLFFYVGFVGGTFLCAVATDFTFLLVARIITGLFGGVIGSISFAIVTDLFKMETRGRVMGFVQMAFAGSQILGIPIGIWLANHYGWHSPFFMIVGFSIIVGILILLYMRPITEHLKIKSEHSAFEHFGKVVSRPDYIKGFIATVLLATGGFMLMPFGAVFSTHNMGISQSDLPLLYGITGAFSMIFGPLIGKLADNVGKYKIFVAGSILGMIMVSIYTHLGVTPFWVVVAISVILFVGISSRMISSSALLTAVPTPQDRGAFMSINSSIQQLSGGVASIVAGLIVIQQPSGILSRYDILGYVVVGSMMIAIYLMYRLDVQVKKNSAANPSSNNPLAQPTRVINK